MTKNRCQYLIKQIANIQKLKLQYDNNIPLLPESKDECLKLKNTISEIITDTKESIRIKWTNYEQLSQVELELKADLMEHVIITDDDRLISTSENIISIYDSRTGKLEQRFKGAKNIFTSLTNFGYGFFITGEYGDTIKLWDTSGRRIKTFQENKNKSVKSMFNNIIPTESSFIDEITPLTPDSFVSLGGSNNKSVILWDINSGKEIKRMNRPDFINSGKFSRHIFKIAPNKVVVTCGKEIIFWNTDSGTEETIDLTEKKLGFVTDSASIIAIRPVSANKVEVFITDEDNRIGESIILDTESKSISKTNNLNHYAVNKVFVTSNGGLVNLCSTTSNSWLEFVDPLTGEKASEPFEKKVKFIKETKDYKIVTVDDERKITIWGDPEDEEDEN